MTIADIFNWSAVGLGIALVFLLAVYLPIAHQIDKRKKSSRNGK